MENLSANNIMKSVNLFDDLFLDGKGLFIYSFDQLPNELYIGMIDGERASEALQERFGGKTIAVYRNETFAKGKKKYEFSAKLILMDNRCLFEFDSTWCQCWHSGEDPDFVREAATLIASFKMRMRRKPQEINLIIRTAGKLDLKALEIRRTKLDIGLYYNPGFAEIDALVRQRLNKKRDKGIVLLHGLPGTGKTTYLRYLIGRIKKRILFISPAIAGDLMGPEFIELLTGYPDTVVIIEDAEDVIMDRRNNPGSSVSNLLNISDGLLADFLNIQLICTFNSALTMIDSALLRKGRLIAKYEFGKLGVSQSQRLSDHFGFNTVITQPMTIAEIAGQHEREAKVERMEVLGFRSHLMTN